MITGLISEGGAYLADVLEKHEARAAPKLNAKAKAFGDNQSAAVSADGWHSPGHYPTI
jgi:D-alanyl-D-alanine carboxypeptidase